MNKSLLHLFCSLISCLVFTSGCSFFPQSDSISEVENQAVRARFKEMIAKQKDCHCCIDDAVKARFENFFHTGSIAGYLQSMSPAYLKFMALSPLGQPLMILTSDGATFRYVDVPERTEYTGSVKGETFQKYAPAGFRPEFTFYWLTGKLSPGDIGLVLTRREKNGKRYWIEIQYGDNRKGMVLFDPASLQIYHHLVYDQADDVILEILYDDYTKETCGIPRSVIVTSLTLNTTLHLKFGDLVEKVSLSRDDFSYTVPPSFKQEVVN